MMKMTMMRILKSSSFKIIRKAERKKKKMNWNDISMNRMSNDRMFIKCN